MTAANADIAPAAAAPPVVRIHRRQGWRLLDLAEMWRYRDLLALLALRDVKVRYKQAVLGGLWAILQPIVAMVVFTFIFGNLAGISKKIDYDGPYALFLFAGLLGWQFFESSVTTSSGSLINNAAMLRKIYFPRLIMPIAALGAPLVDYVLSFAVLAGVMAWFGQAPGWRMLMLPLVVLSTMLAVLGVSILLSALTVSYRDFKYIVPFMVKIWFFITPVLYDRQLITGRLPDSLHWLIDINPMTGPICAFRATILGLPVDYSAWAISTSMALVTLALGVVYFYRVQRRFADII